MINYTLDGQFNETSIRHSNIFKQGNTFENEACKIPTITFLKLQSPFPGTSDLTFNWDLLTQISMELINI